MRLSSLAEEATSFSSSSLFSEQQPTGSGMGLRVLMLQTLPVLGCDFETFSWKKLIPKGVKSSTTDEALDWEFESFIGL